MINQGVIQLEYICTNDQSSNILIKPLAKVKLKYFRERLGMIICNDFFFEIKELFVSSILYVMKGDDLSWTYSVIFNYLQCDDLVSRDYFCASLHIA